MRVALQLHLVLELLHVNEWSQLLLKTLLLSKVVAAALSIGVSVALVQRGLVLSCLCRRLTRHAVDVSRVVLVATFEGDLERWNQISRCHLLAGHMIAYMGVLGAA